MEDIKIRAQSQFWSDIGSTKEFTDPFFVGEFSKFVPKNKLVIEYGCGYGRVLNILYINDFEELIGFDFAPKMIEKGAKAYPYLDLRLLEESCIVPLENESVDAVILSTVLTCIADSSDQIRLMSEINRITKKDGIIYLSDFLISENYKARYDKFKDSFGEYGIFKSSEGAIVRHHSRNWIESLLQNYQLLFYKEFGHVTMNNNPIKSFVTISKKL